MKNDLIHFPPAIIHEYRREAKQVKKEKASEPSNEDLLIRSFFNSTNKLRGADGRTYEYIDEDGNYVSRRVSPYSVHIFDNLEPLVKDLVLKLIEKGYLTTDSCQGHSDRKYSFVNVAFNSEKQMNDFINFFKLFNSNIKYKIIDLKNPKSNGFRFVYNQQKFNHKKLKVKDYTNLTYTYKEAIMYFNTMFMRNYSDYYLVQIILTDGRKILDPINYITYHFFRKQRINNILKHIENNLPNYEDKL